MTEGNRDPVSKPSLAASAGDVTLFWIAAVLLRQRRSVIAITLLGLLVAGLWAFTRPATYTSTFSFVPQASQDQGRSGLASLAGEFGMSLGGANQAQSPQFYADLLHTRSLLEPIARDSLRVSVGDARPVPLDEYFRIEAPTEGAVVEKTIRRLRTDVINVSVATRTTGVVTVDVRTESPILSLEIAKRLLAGANDFNLRSRQSQAAEERQFVERRLTEERQELRRMENALQDFLQRNRQVGGAPHLLLERDRRERQVATQQQLVDLLTQQFEDARIREIRDTPVITVIEQPVVPAQPNPRGRALMLLGGPLLGFLIGIFVAIARASMQRYQSRAQDPAAGMLAGEWRRMRGAKA